MWSWRSWLIRLAFSFYIVAFALFWRGQRFWRDGDRGWRPTAFITGAMTCVALGSLGVRLRHARPPRDDGGPGYP